MLGLTLFLGYVGPELWFNDKWISPCKCCCDVGCVGLYLVLFMSVQLWLFGFGVTSELIGWARLCFFGVVGPELWLTKAGKHHLGMFVMICGRLGPCCFGVGLPHVVAWCGAMCYLHGLAWCWFSLPLGLTCLALTPGEFHIYLCLLCY